MNISTSRPDNADRVRKILEIRDRCHLERLKTRDRLMGLAIAAADRGDAATATYYRNEASRLAAAPVKYSKGTFTVDPPPSRAAVSVPAAAVDLAGETRKRRAVLAGMRS